MFEYDIHDIFIQALVFIEELELILDIYWYDGINVWLSEMFHRMSTIMTTCHYLSSGMIGYLRMLIESKLSFYLTRVVYFYSLFVLILIIFH